MVLISSTGYEVAQTCHVPHIIYPTPNPLYQLSKYLTHCQFFYLLTLNIRPIQNLKQFFQQMIHEYSGNSRTPKIYLVVKRVHSNNLIAFEQVMEWKGMRLRILGKLYLAFETSRLFLSFLSYNWSHFAPSLFLLFIHTGPGPMKMRVRYKEACYLLL